MILPGPNHPIWDIAQLLIVSVAMLVAMWMFANNFDETEVKSFMVFLGIVGPAIAGVWKLRRSQMSESKAEE